MDASWMAVRHQCAKLKLVLQLQPRSRDWRRPCTWSAGKDSLVNWWHDPAKVEPRIIVDDFEALKIFIISGDDIGALSRLICETEVANAKITRVLPGWSLQLGSSQVSIHFVYPAQRYISQKTRAFIEVAMRNE
jgi:DNA-binding transcriptional LysR family regulator